MLSHTLFPNFINKLSLLKLGLALSIGLTTINAAPLLASHLEAAPLAVESSTSQPGELYLAQGSQSSTPVADGIYLYGQSATPEQIGQEYLVFKVDRGQVIGAFYMPQSEFSCFSGTFNTRAMNVSIVDPYDQTTYPYSIALRDISPLASNQPPIRNVGLDGYYRIQSLSDNDHRMLNTCLQQTR